MIYKVEIPQEYVDIMKNEQGSAEKYIETVLIQPLIKKYRQNTFEAIKTNSEKAVNIELKKFKKETIIKQEKEVSKEI